MRQLLAITLLLLLGATARAQPTDEQLGLDAHFYLILFPELRTLPAPAWLTPGVRVTYSSLASVGSAGAALSQNDVVAANGQEVLVFQHAYADIGDGIVPLSNGQIIGRPGVGGFWVNPQVLLNAERVAGNGLTVSRYKKDVVGQNIDVVRFQSDTDTSRQAYEFDSKTGLMTFSSFTTANTVTQLWLVGIRGVAIPWTPSRAPNWVRTGAANQYSGTYTTTLQGSPPFSQRIDLTMLITASGARWSVHQRQSALDGAASDTTFGLTGEAQIVGNLWLPRSALAIAAPADGVLIDDDPLTGAKTFLARTELGIVLQQQTSASRTTAIYDPASGVLTRYVQEQLSGIAVISVDVARTGGSDLAALAAQPEGPDDPPIGTAPGGNEPGGNTPGGNEPGGNTPGGNEPGGNTPGGNEPGGNTPGGNEPGGNEPGTATPQPGGSTRPGCEGGADSSAPIALLGVALLLHLARRRGRPASAR